MGSSRSNAKADNVGHATVTRLGAGIGTAVGTSRPLPSCNEDAGTSIPADAPSEQKHVHKFLQEETYDEDSDEWIRKCACGFSVRYERV